MRRGFSTDLGMRKSAACPDSTQSSRGQFPAVVTIWPIYENWDRYFNHEVH